MTNIIARALNDYANGLNKSWSHDRASTVGASEVGQCARKVFWLKNENDSTRRADRDPEYRETWGARMRGTVFEDKFWVPAMRAKFGKRLLYAGKEQKTLIGNFLSATPDGLLIGLTPQECLDAGLPVEAHSALVECKTADPRTNLQEAKSANVYQTQVQMGLMRENTTHAPTHAILSYTDASFWSEVKEFVIEFDEHVFEVAKERAMTIMTAEAATGLKPEGWIAGGTECNHCPFTKACGIERRNLPFQDIAPIDPQFEAEIVAMARTLRRAEDKRDDSDKMVREMAEQIKHRLREKGVKKIPGVLTWSSVKGRSGYDNRAIKQAAVEAGVDITQFEIQGEPSDRLVIQIGLSKDEPMPGTAPAVA
jgi:hypothetical protein